MGFRIRKDSDASDYEDGETSYRAHLASIRARLPSDLWRFFAIDFFHDGILVSFSLLPEIELVLSCPNICDLEDSTKPRYVSALFRCKFSNATALSWVVDESNVSATDLRWRFAYAEINSIERPRGYHSLLIQLQPDSSELGIVFKSIEVSPVEPLAYALVASNPRYRVPAPE